MNPSNDLALLYAGWPAINVVWIPKAGQGSTGRAIFDEPGTAFLGNEVIGTECALRYPASQFPNVRKGDRFIVDGHTYIARENAQPTLDGLENIAPLTRAL